MKSPLRTTLFLFLGLLLPLHANIGDSVAQCVKRYGKPIGYSEANPKTPFGTLVFSAAGMQLIVFLLGENEVGSRISKTDKSAFTDAEMQNVMNAEGDPKSPWTPKRSDDPTCLEWTRADKAEVMYDKVRHVLIISSPAMTAGVHQMAAESKSGAPATNAPATNAPAATTGTIPAWAH